MTPIIPGEILTIDHLVEFRKAIQKSYIKREGWKFKQSEVYDVEFTYDEIFDFSKLTIGMSLFNRPVYFESCIQYISKHFPGAKLIVADSSNEKNKKLHWKAIQTYCNKFSNLDIQHKLFPENALSLEPIEFIVENAKTPYFLKWDDDDFYNPIAINSGIQTMDNDDVIVSVNGPSINIFRNSPDPESDILVGGHFTPDFNQTRIHDRLVILAVATAMTWYNLTRVNVYKNSMNNIMYLKSTKMDQLVDIAFSLNIAMHGNSHMTDDLFMIRRTGQSRISTNKNHQKRDLIYKLFDESEYAYFLKFRSKMLQTLTQKFSKITAEFAEHIIDDVCKAILLGSDSRSLIFRSLNRDLLVQASNVDSWVDACRRQPHAINFLLSTISKISKT
ncbi:TIGR00180 family glycosyltransferase [Thalassobaculum sp.]|uniref:TIGR00180 family glycosyltransferase n=1 Tax=Thalassobaculum sp. TaxID=2022740 RepID=UPI0032EE578B